ncbi:hypothetical protein ACRARG_03410 [Pseudooceanicola sp. C21-150M6]|uniref:hypothetical protein n=1 Tax=Pseudooceanicola sp. C21-150M6 TaxID=3434355 RepID=UPI003D800086
MSLHRTYLCATFGAAVIALSGCAVRDQMRDNWINRSAGTTRVYIDEGDYDVSFLPLASPPGRAADAWVLGPRVSAPFTIEGGGAPALRISRADGIPMTEADHENAVAAASAGCVDRPGWTPAKATALARPIARVDSTKYFGAGYLTQGAWTLMGVCK